MRRSISASHVVSGDFLLRIPLVILRRTQPHVHFAIRIQIHIRQPENDRFVIERLRHALDQRRKVKGNDVSRGSRFFEGPPESGRPCVRASCCRH